MTETVDAWRVLLLLAVLFAPTVERHDFMRMVPTVEAFRIDIEHQHIKIDIPPEGSP